MSSTATAASWACRPAHFTAEKRLCHQNDCAIKTAIKTIVIMIVI